VGVGAHLLLQLAGGVGGGEVLDQVVEGGEVDGEAALAGLDAEGDREVGLADAGRSEQQDVLLLLEETERSELGDARPVERRLKGEVEAVERAQSRKARELERIADAAALASGELFLEEPVEQVRVGPGLLLGLVEHAVELLLEGDEAEAAEVVVETLADEFGHAQALPSSAA
jgi:hypothetical protein